MVGDAFHLSFGIQTALSELNRQNAMDGLSCLFEAWLSEQYTWVLRAKWSLEMWFIIYRGVTIQIHFFVQVSFTEKIPFLVLLSQITCHIFMNQMKNSYQFFFLIIRNVSRISKIGTWNCINYRQGKVSQTIIYYYEIRSFT